MTPTVLPLIPTDDTVVFPGTTITLTSDVGDATDVLLVPREGHEYAAVGTIAEVVERGRVRGRGHVVVVTGRQRAVPGQAVEGADGMLSVTADPVDDSDPPKSETTALEQEYRATVEEILELRGADERVGEFLRSITGAGALADTAGYSPSLTYAQKVQLLETIDVVERLTLAVQMQREALTELQVRRRIRDDIESETSKQQREYFLRKQMDSIRRELGDDEASVAQQYQQRIDESQMPDEVREHAERELRRMERMGEGGSGEAQMIRSWLDQLLGVPWGVSSDDAEGGVTAARTVLDADHAGLEDVKDRIVEFLAVRDLRRERGIEMDRRAGAILTLVGPPGTGKTSIGESVARALGREYQRIALGGVRDEAEIRGHRRTYIGSMPGRLVRALRDAGTMNPVIVLDEVDKLGADWRGDPSSALLEVLDPAQNHSFRDHYLDVELDLSGVFFIATANQLDQIPGPLRDRMEVITFDGYTPEEKRAIAERHLWPRQLRSNGLLEGEAILTPDALAAVVTEYTREAGVRQLERALGKVLRKTATRIAAGDADAPVSIDEAGVRDALGRRRYWSESAERTAVPGVATGLAVTGTGGDVLFVEATSMPGSDPLVLTGQLGDVMRESARIALTWVQSHAADFDISADAFDGRTFHLHVPAGAIPKDGPSAGITMATALVSLLTGRPVRHTVGMTGELTLRGRVMPIGGLKQKVLAAHAAGLTDVVLPERNRGDLADVPDDVANEMSFHPSMSLVEVLDVALEPAPVPTT